GFASALSWSATFGIAYLAIEPFARRYWPNALVSSTRVLRGRWNDTRLGRDLLVGVFGGTAATLLVRLPTLAGFEAPFSSFHDVLENPLTHVGVLCSMLLAALFVSLGRIAGLVLFRLMFRTTALACLADVVVFSAMEIGFQQFETASAWTLAILVECILMFLFVHFGFLTLFSAFCVLLLLETNLTLDSGSFYFANGVITGTVVFAAAAIGCRIALGRRSIWNAFE
ncbi:MAG: hypothetical protein KDA72_22375, partial [Planctomycetales bacterium]|nr:hypothetical protein [Planctomycetales bacterium]